MQGLFKLWTSTAIHYIHKNKEIKVPSTIYLQSSRYIKIMRVRGL